jgi:hypothetical protein
VDTRSKQDARRRTDSVHGSDRQQAGHNSAGSSPQRGATEGGHPTKADAAGRDASGLSGMGLGTEGGQGGVDGSGGGSEGAGGRPRQKSSAGLSKRTLLDDNLLEYTDGRPLPLQEANKRPFQVQRLISVHTV